MPSAFATRKTANNEATHWITAKITCGNPSLLRPRTNCGPTPYPTANRNMRKNTDFTCGEITMCSWPNTTPTNSVPVTAPSVNEPILSRPTQYPRARVRKMANSGYVRNVSISHCSMWFLSNFGHVETRRYREHSPTGGCGQRRRADHQRALLAALCLASASGLSSSKPLAALKP
jgi:hypothetical protein